MASHKEVAAAVRDVEDWFRSVPRSGSGVDGADLDVVDFHRSVAGDPERVRLAPVGTLARLSRERERRW